MPKVWPRGDASMTSRKGASTPPPLRGDASGWRGDANA
jgi:hypothetical protein